MSEEVLSEEERGVKKYPTGMHIRQRGQREGKEERRIEMTKGQ